MKLMTMFRQQLEQLGEIRRVWMTSFNININFVETYILPVVLGMEPPRSRMDYETFQLALTERDIDFRVFCDKRMLGADQYKRTGITVQPVSVREVAPFPGLTCHSLFHPKVIYLEDAEGNMILGAGSANLTFSGWGRNQEAMDFRRVSNKQQYQQIRRFFSAIATDTDLPVRKKYSGEDHGWEFVHSFGERSLLDYLATCGNVSRLTVWSPYLAADLPGFIGQLAEYFGNPGLKVALVADRIEGRYLRTLWREPMAGMLTSGQLCFHDNPGTRHECTEMTHAKVWQAAGSDGTVMAIGSWNFTVPGCSSLAGRRRHRGDSGCQAADLSEWSNVEAGIFHRCEGHPRIVGQAYTPAPEDFASDLQLREDAIDVPEPLPFDLVVLFDWQQAQYRIEGTWHDGSVDDGYVLRVPGIAGTLSLQWKPRKRTMGPMTLPVEESESLLASHFYCIEKDGEVVYQGVIIEKGLAFRRALGFNSLEELLTSCITGTDPKINDSLGLRSCLQDRVTPDEENAELFNKPEAAPVSYFRMFYAMHEYRKRLEGTRSMEELQQWLFGYPGCLQELAEKVQAHIKQTDAPVFNWFLANEVNTLYRVALKQYDRYRPRYSPKTPPDHQWRHLRVDIPELPADDSRRSTYLETIRRECGYEG